MVVASTWIRSLWLSESSEVVANHGWLSSVHKVAGGRYHTLIFSVEGGGNLLQPTYLKQVQIPHPNRVALSLIHLNPLQMYKVRKMIFEAELPNGEPSWKELCLRLWEQTFLLFPDHLTLSPGKQVSSHQHHRRNHRHGSGKGGHKERGQ